MSDVEPIEEVDTSHLLDAPNQQVVRDAPPEPEADPLDDMTKAELIEEAASRGVEVDETARKDEIREALG